MKFFHDEEDGPQEPVRGLPEQLPEGEKILWQGSPSGLALAFGAFRLRWIIGYFVVMTLFRTANLTASDAAPAALTEAVTSSLIFCAVATAIVLGLAWSMSRAAVFTITNHRVVLRYGVAIRKYVNVPFSKMGAAQLSRKSARVGDISFKVTGPGKPPYLHLWPFARPLKFSDPQPMMRGIKEPDMVAETLARAVQAQAPETVKVELGRKAEKPVRDRASASSIPAI